LPEFFQNFQEFISVSDEQEFTSEVCCTYLTLITVSNLFVRASVYHTQNLLCLKLLSESCNLANTYFRITNCSISKDSSA